MLRSLGRHWRRRVLVCTVISALKLLIGLMLVMWSSTFRDLYTPNLLALVVTL